MTVLYALAGLSGANSFTAGALSRFKINPEDTVTATSGAIWLLSEYVKGNDLRSSYQRILPWAIGWGSLIPVHPLSWYQDVAETLNTAPFRVVFGAHDLVKNMIVLYGNERAMRHELGVYQPITAEAVENALYLSLYDFSKSKTKIVDCAYIRPVIMEGELYDVDDVVFPSPLQVIGSHLQPDFKIPSNPIELLEWNTRIQFSQGYRAELKAVRGARTATGNKIQIIRRSPNRPIQFFVESEELYLDGQQFGSYVTEAFQEEKAHA